MSSNKPDSDGFDLLQKLNDPEEAKKLKNQAESERAKIFFNAFQTEPGKKALNILSLKYYNQECFTEDNPNPYIAAKRDGQRSVLKEIYDQMSRGRYD